MRRSIEIIVVGVVFGAFICLSVFAFRGAACASTQPAPLTRPDNILTSDNNRFERREWIDDDGWHFTVTDKVKGTVLVLETTEQRGALMGVGDEAMLREHGLRVSMGTKGGFKEWEQDVRVDPQ